MIRWKVAKRAVCSAGDNFIYFKMYPIHSGVVHTHKKRCAKVKFMYLALLYFQILSKYGNVQYTQLDWLKIKSAFVNILKCFFLSHCKFCLIKYLAWEKLWGVFLCIFCGLLPLQYLGCFYVYLSSSYVWPIHSRHELTLQTKNTHKDVLGCI